MSAEQRLLAVSPNLPCAMDRQEWSLEDYHICKTLYNGYAAQVYTATCRYSGMEVVLKVYHDVDKAPDVAQHEMYREVAIQSGLQHPNVVHLFGAFEEGDTLVLVQEYVPNGDLLALMQNHGGKVDEATVVKVVLRPLLGALMYLHRWGIVHRDVKPENVLFAGDGSIKLADFGLAINMVEERPISRVGTLDYMAPEVLRCPIKQSMAMTPAPGAPARYGFATDVWAVGIVTFELLTGLPPYASDCRYQAEQRICSSLPPIFPSVISPMARDFILRALAPIPGDRPTVRQMLEHPWIANPDACLAPSRAPALSHAHAHSYPYAQPQPQPQPQPHRSSFPLSQPAASSPQHHQHFTAGCSNSDPLHPSASRAAVDGTAVSSPVGSVHTPAPAAPLASHFSAAAVATSADQQLRSLREKQLLDLSKLPLDQIQGMIQELQEAMQLAIVQQRAAASQEADCASAAVVAAAAASAVANPAVALALAAAHSRCSGGGVAAEATAPAISSNAAVAAAAASYAGGDVHMTEAVPVSLSAPALASGAYAVAVAGAVSSAALSCSNSPQQLQSAHVTPRGVGAAAAGAAAAAQPCRISPNAVIVADSASYVSTATGYGSLCASRRTTLEATPRGAPAAFAAMASDSPTQVSCVQHAPTPLAASAFELTTAPARTADGSPACRGSSGQQVLVVPAPAGSAAVAAATLRPTCSGGGVVGGGSQGGALHEGDGLVYVSIGSSRKAAGGAAGDGDECMAGGIDAREALMAAWMRQFGAP